MVQETVTMEGHLIDSDILRRAFNRIVEEGGEFEVVEFRVGKSNQEPSFARLAVKAPGPEALDRILEGLNYLGASTTLVDARFAYFHTWQADDAIVWDNWRTIHCATGVPFDVDRFAQRTTIVGDYKLGRYLDPARNGQPPVRRLDD